MMRRLISDVRHGGVHAKNADASCLSRQVLKPANANIFPHVVEDRPQPPTVSKVSVNLPVPCGVLTLADERCKLCQLAGGKRLNSIFDISKTHGSKLAKELFEGKCSRR